MPSGTDGPPVGAVRLLGESLPLAAVTLSWVVVSWVANDPLVGTGARHAGVVMAGAYAVARGAALARESTGPGPSSSDVPDGRFAGSAWLLVARLVPPPLLRGTPRLRSRAVRGYSPPASSACSGRVGTASDSRDCPSRPPRDSPSR
jgi:hypothetical protein